MLPRSVLAVSLLNRIYVYISYIKLILSPSLIYILYIVSTILGKMHSVFGSRQFNQKADNISCILKTKSGRHFGCEVYLALCDWHLCFQFGAPEAPAGQSGSGQSRMTQVHPHVPPCSYLVGGENMFAVGYVK